MEQRSTLLSDPLDLPSRHGISRPLDTDFSSSWLSVKKSIWLWAAILAQCVLLLLYWAHTTLGPVLNVDNGFYTIGMVYSSGRPNPY